MSDFETILFGFISILIVSGVSFMIGLFFNSIIEATFDDGNTIRKFSRECSLPIKILFTIFWFVETPIFILQKIYLSFKKRREEHTMPTDEGPRRPRRNNDRLIQDRIRELEREVRLRQEEVRVNNRGQELTYNNDIFGTTHTDTTIADTQQAFVRAAGRVATGGLRFDDGLTMTREPQAIGIEEPTIARENVEYDEMMADDYSGFGDWYKSSIKSKA